MGQSLLQTVFATSYCQENDTIEVVINNYAGKTVNTQPFLLNIANKLARCTSYVMYSIYITTVLYVYFDIYFSHVYVTLYHNFGSKLVTG